MTVNEMCKRLSTEEYTQWRAFYSFDAKYQASVDPETGQVSARKLTQFLKE